MAVMPDCKTDHVGIEAGWAFAIMDQAHHQWSGRVHASSESARAIHRARVGDTPMTAVDA